MKEKEIYFGKKPDALDEAIFKSRFQRKPRVTEAEGCVLIPLKLLGYKVLQMEEQEAFFFRYDKESNSITAIAPGSVAVELNEEASEILKSRIFEAYLRKNYTL